MVGFKIVFDGELPKDAHVAKVITKIVRECATNAIRHANATALFVNISKNKIEITDNGKVSFKSFSEGTGIKGMRLASESIGGKLNIDTTEQFKIVLNF